MKLVLIILLVTSCISVFCQDTIQLQNVVIKGVKRPVRIGIEKQQQISLDQVVQNSATFTNLLRYNAPISFKDYGNGGVSSASFRGTSASNTAVLWNGVPINSSWNGQTDFNAMSALTSDNINIKSGGSSAQNGSGAIGGTIELNDKLTFNAAPKFHLFSSFGSFKTTSNFFKTHYGTQKWAVKLASSFNYSKNDYEYLDDRYKSSEGKQFKNENGNYQNYDVSFAIARKFLKNHKLSFFTTAFYGKRHFSSGFPNSSTATEKYEDFNYRNLLRWEYRYLSFKHTVNVSHLTQKYHYYPNKAVKKFNFGNSKNTNINYKVMYQPSTKIGFETSLLYANTTGQTDRINNVDRNMFFTSLAVNFKPTNRLKLNLTVSKEKNTAFKVPVVFNSGISYKVVKNLKLKGTFSKNYRVPTFNDLYWPSSGNINLIPEVSLQTDAGFDFSSSFFDISSMFFYINLKDKILWKPSESSNFWKPINIDNVINKGVETTFNFHFNFAKFHRFNISGNYVYTLAKDQKDNSFLPFVPKHLFNLNTQYTFKWFSVFFQSLQQSNVFTNSININFYSLKAVSVQNIGITCSLFKTKNVHFMLGAKVNNIQNSVYYFTNLRPMPGRNYTVNINYKF